MKLQNKVAIITGGGKGIGAEISLRLAKEGAKIVIAEKDIESAENIKKKIIENKGDAIVVDTNVANEDSVNQMAEAAIKKFGKIDILINNAVSREFGSAGWKNTLDDFDKSLRINASALFKITQLFSEDMKKNNSGSIINIGSMMGTVGVENGNYEGTDFTPATSPLYFYEKGGMHNFTRWAASMLGPFNIRVNCLAPGGFQVPSHPKRFVENYSKRTQLGRMANSSDLKGPIIFLASDSSAYLTGTIIAVDGGYTAK